MSEKHFSISVDDDGTVRVQAYVGDYGKVGYRAAYVYMREQRVAGHGKGYVPAYGTDELDRAVACLGKDGEKVLLDIVKRVAVMSLTPTKEEEERDFKFAQEATEEEERLAKLSGTF